MTNISLNTSKNKIFPKEKITLIAKVMIDETEIKLQQLRDNKFDFKWESSSEKIKLIIDSEDFNQVLLETGENIKPDVYNVTVKLIQNNKIICCDTCSITVVEYFRCSVTGNQYKPNSFLDAVHFYIMAPEIEEDASLIKLFAAHSDLFQRFTDILRELEIHTIEAVNVKTFIPALINFERKWLKIIVVLINNKFPSEAKIAANRLYQIVRAQEIVKRERFHKGTMLWWLARSEQELGAIDNACHYFLLTMLEDIRNDAVNWQSCARDWLINSLQIEDTIDKLGKSTQKFCLKIIGIHVNQN